MINPPHSKTLHLISLGCPKNLVDAEVMLAALEQEGYRMVDHPQDASLLLVNTCGFLQSAAEEAIDEILALAEWKKKDAGKKLVVSGCLVQRHGRELMEALPEVDLFLGLDNVAAIAELVAGLHTAPVLAMRPGPSRYLMNSEVRRRISTPFFRSYLKLSEGCDNRCSYCMIPSIRGTLRSRPLADLMNEAKWLEAQGVRELSLIAQDLTAYGRDLRMEQGLVQLLRMLLDETSIPWIRLLYLYPSSITQELLRLIDAQPRLTPYFDLPMQHVSSPILKAMRRNYDEGILDKLVDSIRALVPGAALRSTFIVGFPGETEHDIALLINNLKKWRLEHVGVFAYQDEVGSMARKLTGKIANKEKLARLEQVMATQASISEELLRLKQGTVEDVLVEGISRESDLLLEGRTRQQAPEIDGCVYITSGQARPGEIVPVLITETHAYDLVGEILTMDVGQ